MRPIDADKLLERMKKGMESGSNLNGTFDLYIEHAPTIEMSGDLISRQGAINCCSCLHPEECWDEIRKLPSAVEVVRCKDCMRYMMKQADVQSVNTERGERRTDD